MGTQSLYMAPLLHTGHTDYLCTAPRLHRGHTAFVRGVAPSIKVQSCGSVQESCSVCMLHWTSWQPESSQKPTDLELVRMAEVNTDPDGQPGGHYHQSLISPWGVAVAAHGKANDNHIIVLGKPMATLLIVKH